MVLGKLGLRLEAVMLPDSTVTEPETRRTLGRAYVEEMGECEKAISHHFRQRQPEELIELVPELSADVAAIARKIPAERA